MGRDCCFVFINNVHLWSFSGDIVRMAEIAAISIVAISYNIREISQGIPTIFNIA